MVRDAGEVVHRRGGSRALESGTVMSLPAVSETRCLGSGGVVMPSRATIAPSPWRRPPWAAIRAIVNDGTDDTRTQHWPQLTARTNAPWHTRTTWLPSTPTSWHWKAVPVSPPITNEDENGDATTTVSAVRARCLVKCDCGDNSVVMKDVVRALVKRASPILHLLDVPPPATPSTASNNTLHGIRFLLHHLPAIPTLPFAPPAMGVAVVSLCNLVDSTKSETAATSSSCVVGAVGPHCPNDDGGIVDVPANLAGTINPGTPTSPLLAPVAA